MNDSRAARLFETYGPCVRCGRISLRLVMHPDAGLAVMHVDEFPECPIRSGEMPVGSISRPSPS